MFENIYFARKYANYTGVFSAFPAFQNKYLERRRSNIFQIIEDTGNQWLPATKTPMLKYDLSQPQNS